MGKTIEKEVAIQVEVADLIDRVSYELAALGLALAGAEARGGICPDELRGLSLLLEGIISELRGIKRR